MERRQKYRDVSLDVLKGILVVQMVLCHCIQFFGNDGAPVQKEICDYINLTSFSGFMFAFGFGCQYAYFGRRFREAAPRMVRTAVKCLLAFYLSSICYIALVEYDYYDPRVFRQVLLLQKYAGWSEFLASFFGVMVVALVFFAAFQRMNGYLFAGIGVLSLLLTFLPFEEVHHPWAALFVGSADYNTFPVLLYLFYFAAGVYLCRRRRETERDVSGEQKKRTGRWLPPVLAAALSLPEFWLYHTTGGPSLRFPPDWQYLFGASAILYAYWFVSRKLCGEKKRAAGGIGGRLAGSAAACLRFVLSELGENAIFYLLFSNLVIFAFAGSSFKLRTINFTVRFYIVLMLSAWFCQHLVKGRRPAAKAPGCAVQNQTEKITHNLPPDGRKGKSSARRSFDVRDAYQKGADL